MEQKGISNSTLKWIAIVSMLIDHVGATILWQILQKQGVASAAVEGLSAILTLDGANKNLALLWWVMRMLIGRLAFPIYCFLLVEGFRKTKNVWKYAGRLFLFAIISEIPYDLCIFRQTFTLYRQNVFFTLLIGLLCMQSIKVIEQLEERPEWIKWIAKLLTFLLGMGTAWLFKTDYAESGVIFILLLYFFRYTKTLQIAAGCVGSLLILNEMSAPLAFIPISFYNGERGIRLKYIFYLFYPTHLLLLYMLCVMLKLI